MHVLVEFLLSLCKVVWFTLVGVVKLFVPNWKKKDVRNEIVLITGSGSGIGRLMAIRFAKLGARMVLWDINKKANDSVAEEIKAMGHSAYAYEVDCSKREDIYRVADQVKQDIGDVTVLVNNAGIVSGKPFYDLPDDMIDLTFKVNTVAHMWMIKAFVPNMKAKNHGYIITISSSAGLFGVASLVDYCASKFGAVGIHESMASEISALGADGIKSTLVCPFYINTGMFDGVKTRFPLLLPILPPDYAVDKIMSAFHSNRYMLMMPRILYLFYFLHSFLPKDALLEAGRFFDVNSSMNSFKGRAKKED